LKSSHFEAIKLSQNYQSAAATHFLKSKNPEVL